MPKLKTKKKAIIKPQKSKVTKTSITTTAKLSAEVFDTTGRRQGTIVLAKEVFGQKPNEKLLSQAIRVYFNNQSTHAAHTKTRSEVRGGGAKPHRQKGTGRARAGSIRSPLWVGGGVALGPRRNSLKLSLPKKMKRRALHVALSSKLQSGNIKVISNIDKIPAKTKILSSLLNKLQVKGNTLLVITQGQSLAAEKVKLASRNIPQVSLCEPSNLNAFEVIKNQDLLFSKEAIVNIK